MPVVSLGEMIERLKANASVVGLVEYGSAALGDDAILGDYDLVAFLEPPDPQVESLHFCVGETPVDLNLRTVDQIRALSRAVGFDSILLDARVIHDPSGIVAEELAALKVRHQQAPVPSCSETDLAMKRHGTRHAIDRARARLDTSPTLCCFLLHQNVYWLTQSYFEVRNLQFPGEKRALAYLRENEPQLSNLMDRFFGTTDPGKLLATAEQIAAIALQPVGGPWNHDELLAFGPAGDIDLQKKGREVYAELFGASG